MSDQPGAISSLKKMRISLFVFFLLGINDFNSYVHASYSKLFFAVILKEYLNNITEKMIFTENIKINHKNLRLKSEVKYNDEVMKNKKNNFRESY